MNFKVCVVVASLGIFTLASGACGSASSDTGSGGAASSSIGVGPASATTAIVAVSSSTGGTVVKTDASCDAPAVSPSKGACFVPVKPDCTDLNGGGGAGGGPTGDCSKIFEKPNDCTTCLTNSCCSELAVCKGILNCVACLITQTEMDKKLCGTPEIDAAATKLGHCQECTCATECLQPPCNPVTNEPCDTGAGEACDHAGGGKFQCYAAPNDAKLCEACDAMGGPYCEGGHTCHPDGGCAKFCCNDGDCGTGTCALYQGTMLGTCVKK